MVLFQADVYVTLGIWNFLKDDWIVAYNFLIPIWLILALHAWYMAKKMPDL